MPRRRKAARANSDGGPHDLWIFAYGSLMWRPGFASEEIVHARLVGWRRSFCIYSRFHRGSSASSRASAGPRSRRRVRGAGVSRRAGECARDVALPARARAGGERLPRGAGAGDADFGERAGGDGADVPRRARASELRRHALAREQAHFIRGAAGPLRATTSTTWRARWRISISSAFASASWSAC